MKNRQALRSRDRPLGKAHDRQPFSENELSTGRRGNFGQTANEQ
jgi:hypothetical protein